ncbi:MAG: ATP-binding protein [bacterium]
MEKQSFKSLGTNSLFNSIDIDNLDVSSISGKLITVKEGEILFREGDPANFIYLVVSGEINLLKKKLLGKSKSLIFQNNDFFGYEEYFEETSRTSTAVALRNSYLIALSRIEINSLIAQDEAIRKNLEVSIFNGEGPTFLTQEKQPEPDIKTKERSDSPEVAQQPESTIELRKELEPEFLINFSDDSDSGLNTSTKIDFVEENKMEIIPEPDKDLVEDIIDIAEDEPIEINSLEERKTAPPIEIPVEADLELEAESLNVIDEFGSFEHEVLETNELPDAMPGEDQDFFKKLDEGKFGPLRVTKEDITPPEEIPGEVEKPESEPDEQIDELYKPDLKFVFGNQPAMVSKLNDAKAQKIIEVMESIYSAESLNDLITATEKSAVDMINAEAGLFLMCSDNNRDLFANYFGKEIRMPSETGITGWCCRNNEIVNTDDPQDDLRYDGKTDDPLGRNPQCMLCYPIQLNGKTFGVLQMINNPLHSFSTEDEHMLGVIAKNFLFAKTRLKSAAAKDSSQKSVFPMIANYFNNFVKKPALVGKRYISHLQSKNLPKDAQQILEMLNEQIDKINESVHTIINLSGRENPLHSTPIKINSLLTDFSKRIDPLLQFYKCQITNEFAEDAILKLDENEFYKCYYQIIKNSCESMPSGGDILIATGKEKNELNILIKDNGKGIPEKYHAQIFEPFFTYDKKDGSGLGLNITKKIIEEFNGKIKFESKPGAGSTFIISLPIYSAF